MSGELDEKDVLSFIESRPDFLDTHFGEGGKGVSPNLIDVTGKIAANAREDARRLSRANQSLLDAAATNMLHWQALHHATLGFLACNDLTSFAQMLDEELPVIFGLAGARLLMPEEVAIPQAEELGFLVLPGVHRYQSCSPPDLFILARQRAAHYFQHLLPAWQR